MDKYREILRMYNGGFSQRSIAASCGCSRNTVAKVIDSVMELEVAYSPDTSESEWEAKLFPELGTQCGYKQPDYEYIHRELAKSGVTLRLLWNEYCDSCRLAGGIPYMYTQFCLYS